MSRKIREKMQSQQGFEARGPIAHRAVLITTLRSARQHIDVLENIKILALCWRRSGCRGPAATGVPGSSACTRRAVPVDSSFGIHRSEPQASMAQATWPSRESLRADQSSKM